MREDLVPKSQEQGSFDPLGGAAAVAAESIRRIAEEEAVEY